MLALQRFGHTLVINSRDPELVLVSRHQILNLSLGVLGLQRRQPASGLRVQFLNQVVVNGSATVVDWRLPFQVAALFVDV